MESKLHKIQRRRAKNSKEVETGSNGQEKGIRKRMDTYGHNGNRTTTTANILTDTETTMHRGSNNLRTETTTWKDEIRPLTKINEATTKREKAVQEGNLTQAIKSITGQEQFFYNADSLLLSDGSISTDPVHIHVRLTEALAGHFICPPQHSNSPLQEETL